MPVTKLYLIERSVSVDLRSLSLSHTHTCQASLRLTAILGISHDISHKHLAPPSIHQQHPPRDPVVTAYVNNISQKVIQRAYSPCPSRSTLRSSASTVRHRHHPQDLSLRTHCGRLHNGAGPFTVEVLENLKIRNPSNQPVAFKVRGRTRNPSLRWAQTETATANCPLGQNYRTETVSPPS